MKRTGKLALLVAAAIFGALPLLSQTSSPPRLSFDVISIKPSAPVPRAVIGGIARGDRLTMVSSTLRMVLQKGYQRPSTTPVSPLQIVGGPNWMDSDRYDIQATANCSGGALSQEQIQLMVRSMLEDRFQLKAHMETREGQVYNLVVAKNPPKIKVSEDQTPIPRRTVTPIQPCTPAPEPPANPPAQTIPPGQRGSPFDPDNPAPRGFLGLRMSQSGILIRGSAATIPAMLSMLQSYVGGPITDRTGLTGLFDFTLQFGPEGLVNLDGRSMGPNFGPTPAPGAPPGAAADPVPSLFDAIQELGLKLEPAKGMVEVLVVDSVQKPTEN